MILFKRVDWILLLSAVFITLLGVSVMSGFSENNTFATRQVIWLVLSVFVYMVALNLNFDFLKNGRLLLVLFTLISLALLMVFVLGEVVKGAQSRFYLFGLAFQPADPAKLILIAILAKYFSKRHIEIAHIKHIIISAFYAGVLFVLVAMQPDLGSALILVSIWFFMTLLSGMSKKHLAVLFSGGALLSLLSWFFLLKDYQKDRILVFLDPLKDLQGAGYNAYQSLVAVGSGGITGKGIGMGTQSKLHFLPEFQTDFIFAAFAEEWGFIGILLLFALFTVVFYKIVSIAAHSKSNFVKLFAIGVFAYMMTHFIVNVGMNLGLMPITGITVPFLSYGGSHLITEFLALGILNSYSEYK